MIGERIRQARRACGMTQADLAKGLVSRSYIAAIESGCRVGMSRRDGGARHRAQVAHEAKGSVPFASEGG